MGETFRIVNPAKRQYIDAINLGEGNKRRGILRGYHGLAISCLVCKGAGSGQLFGSWAGDEVFVAGDYASPDEWGIAIKTPVRPDRNLNQMAQDEYEDISCKAIVMLCEFDPSLIEDFVIRASAAHGDVLRSLGHIVYQLRYKPIETALIRIMGKTWTKKFAEEEKKRITGG